MTRAETEKRTAAFERNVELEELLSLVNRVFEPSEKKWLEEGDNGDSLHPLIFIMGPLRSGTTLFTQWLASTGLCAYPTNLMSRFYGAPVMGALVQLLMTDQRYNFRNELFEFQQKIDFSSENGKTIGACAPNEFWFFWRRFLPDMELDWASDEELDRVVDATTLVRELNGLTRVFDKPFALKSMILNYNIPFLNRLFEKALFVRLHRDPVENVASVLEARRRQFGSEDSWYSFRIPEYPELQNLGAIEQSAGQVSYINRAVQAGLASVDESRVLSVEYEKFCDDPRGIYIQLLSKLGRSESGNPYRGEKRFEISRKSDPDLKQKIVSALLQFHC